MRILTSKNENMELKEVFRHNDMKFLAIIDEYNMFMSEFDVMDRFRATTPEKVA